MTCTTCPGEVTHSQYRQGVRRCAACRLAAPGQKNRAKGQPTPPAPPATRSWWADPQYQEWGAFSDRARQLDPWARNRIPMSPGGHRD